MKEQILSYLPGDPPWQNHIQWFDSIDSTNTRAKEMALAGAPHGTVLIADRQTGGRGSKGRSFHSPGGMGVYMSIILRPGCQMRELMHLTCAAAVASCDAVEKAAGFHPGIKWTNDLVLGSRKLAGILTELVLDRDQVCAIIGIGINCCQQEQDFPEDLRGFAGSLTMVTGKNVDRAKVAACLIEAFSDMDKSLLTEKTEMMAIYRANCVTVGKDVSILRGDNVRHGHALSIDEDGGLVVRLTDGSMETVQSGEVSIRGMYGYI